MAKTLASQAKDGGSIPLARLADGRTLPADGYQACSVPQWGQPTEVVTAALNA